MDFLNYIPWIIIAIIVLLIIVRNIRIVQQSKVMIIERLGKFQTTWGTGIHLKIPFLRELQRPSPSRSR